MGTINNLVNGGKYYDLFGFGGSKAGAGQSAGAANASDGAASSSTQKTGAAKSTSYLLDLSADAQKYLNNYTSNASSTNTSSSASKDSGFLLSKKQQATITSIITKYKDAPYTQETFQKIQDDLKQAGLSADKLALVNNARTYNATSIFLEALSGKAVDANTTQQSAGEKQKGNATNYIQSIADQWKRISTTATANFSSNRNA